MDLNSGGRFGLWGIDCRTCEMMCDDGCLLVSTKGKELLLQTCLIRVVVVAVGGCDSNVDHDRDGGGDGALGEEVEVRALGNRIPNRCLWTLRILNISCAVRNTYKSA